MRVLVRRLEADLLAEHQLPLASYDVLVQLVEAPDRRLRMTELAQRVLISRSGLTRLVDRLEREGLVRREACDDDARGLFAVLTEAGFQRLRARLSDSSAWRRELCHRPARRRAGRGARGDLRPPAGQRRGGAGCPRRRRAAGRPPRLTQRLRLALGPALVGLEVLEQLAQLGAQEVAGGDVADRDAQRGQLAGEVVGVGDVALGPRRGPARTAPGRGRPGGSGRAGSAARRTTPAATGSA